MIGVANNWTLDVSSDWNDRFVDVLVRVQQRFIEVFGEQVVLQIPLIIKNESDREQPIAKFGDLNGRMIILAIDDGSSNGRIAYQFAHELMHIVMHAMVGEGKPNANVVEESLCTAASIMFLKETYPEEFIRQFNALVNKLESNACIYYRIGALVGEAIGFDWDCFNLLIKRLCDDYRIDMQKGNPNGRS